MSNSLTNGVVIATPELTAVGPYSLARVVGGMVFLAGQIGIDANSSLVAGGTIAEFKRIMQNVPVVLKAAGSDLSKVIRVVVYLTDIADFAVVNEVYAQSFSKPFPVRSIAQVAALPKGAHIELEITASSN